ncbi:MAG: ribosomal subunit interface protein [Gammaproteobacteria bacterium]|jgi:ribosomal subunit interface protein
MQVQISFSGISHSSAVETAIREKIDKLVPMYANMLTCHVVVSASHQAHHQRNVHHVLINIGVPGTEIIVSRENDSKSTHEDVFAAVSDAFDAARRQLEDYTDIRRGEVKNHQHSVSDGRLAEDTD